MKELISVLVISLFLIFVASQVGCLLEDIFDIEESDKDEERSDKNDF